MRLVYGTRQQSVFALASICVAKVVRVVVMRAILLTKGYERVDGGARSHVAVST